MSWRRYGQCQCSLYAGGVLQCSLDLGDEWYVCERELLLFGSHCCFSQSHSFPSIFSFKQIAFFDSFGGDAPWDQEGISGEDAVNYFYTEIIGLDTVGDDLRPTRIVRNNALYGILVWFCVWLCLAFGMKWTGRVAYFTM